MAFHHFADHDLALAAIQLLACFYIVVRGLRAINMMSRQTRTSIRYGYITMTTGAVYGVVSCLPSPDPATALISAGVALFLFGDMRHVKHA